ncbi:hypothetical protein BDEG_25864 [Batrachochytrium dendrobatidis JEL423]|nr:hypothetical protein BDEG_25864 [Batrachochytrium dendrobatidis JEL423]
MKLLITALSSILAVCSVTVANPVLTSSITSIESTSTTASPRKNCLPEGWPFRLALQAGPSGYGLGILNLESMLAEEVKILKKHREDLNELLLEYSNINEEVTKSRSELGEHFKKNYKTKAMNANGEIDLDLIPEFLSCFDSFYYRLPQ